MYQYVWRICCVLKSLRQAYEVLLSVFDRITRRLKSQIAQVVSGAVWGADTDRLQHVLLCEALQAMV